MLKRLALAGAMALACAPAQAGFWDEAFNTPAQTVRSTKAKASHVHRHRVSRAHPGAGHGVGTRPAKWCGWHALRMFGLRDRSLWLARNWAHVGRPTHAKPGAVVVWRGHVGRVEAVAPGRILVTSGNDGHAVRTRWWSTRGVIAYRAV